MNRVLIGIIVLACSCTTEAQPPVDAPTRTRTEVAKIVFVGQADACDCTKKRTLDSMAVLERILGDRDIPVERLELDTDATAVAPYTETRALMVVPGIYFLDTAGGIIELLQGEVSEGQISELL